jgi:hypothetical protein
MKSSLMWSVVVMVGLASGMCVGVGRAAAEDELPGEHELDYQPVADSPVNRTDLPEPSLQDRLEPMPVSVGIDGASGGISAGFQQTQLARPALQSPSLPRVSSISAELADRLGMSHAIVEQHSDMGGGAGAGMDWALQNYDAAAQAGSLEAATIPDIPVQESSSVAQVALSNPAAQTESFGQELGQAVIATHSETTLEQIEQAAQETAVEAQTELPIVPQEGGVDAAIPKPMRFDGASGSMGIPKSMGFDAGLSRMEIPRTIGFEQGPSGRMEIPRSFDQESMRAASSMQ